MAKALASCACGLAGGIVAGLEAYPEQRMFCLVEFIALFAIAYTDIESRRIPNMLLCALLGVNLAGALIGLPQDTGMAERLAAAASLSLPFCMVAALRKGFGWGDVKLYCVLGFTLGVEASMTLLASSLALGAVTGAIAAIIQKDRQASFPFAPAICTPAFLCLAASCTG